MNIYEANDSQHNLLAAVGKKLFEYLFICFSNGNLRIFSMQHSVPSIIIVEPKIHSSSHAFPKIWRIFQWQVCDWLNLLNSRGPVCKDPIAREVHFMVRKVTILAPPLQQR